MRSEPRPSRLLCWTRAAEISCDKYTRVGGWINLLTFFSNRNCAAVPVRLERPVGRIIQSSLLVAVLLFAAGVYAETTAKSCSQKDVQAALSSAAARDTVIIPAGNCTWQTPVTVANKAVALKGAGSGRTVITDGTAKGALALTGISARNFVDVSGFTVMYNENIRRPSAMILVWGRQPEVAFRIHDVRLLTTVCCTRGIQTIGAYGLIDHVTFDVEAQTGSIQMVSVFGDSPGSDGGFTSWTRPLTLGTENAVYVEDSTFNYGSRDEDCIDAYGGARLVIRHNRFNNAHIGFHGFDSGGYRSVFSFEVYANSFISNSSLAFRAMATRGGTGVVYDNVYGGSIGRWGGVSLSLYRACPSLIHGLWGTCDGTRYQLGSTDLKANGSRVSCLVGSARCLDGITENKHVQFCSAHRDKECTFNTDCTKGETCSTYLDGAGPGGYPCRDQPGRTHDQVLSPVYVWNNRCGPNCVIQVVLNKANSVCGALGITNYLLAGRDYFDDGTSKPGYAAYTYPHPLQAGHL